MSLDEVGGELRAVLDSIRQQRITTAALIQRVTATRDRLQVLTRGSRQPLVAKMLGTWNATVQQLTEADRMLGGAATVLVHYARAIGVNVAAASAVPPASASETEPTGAEGEHHPVPAYVQDAAAKLTWPSPGTNHTYGIALGADGQPIWRDTAGNPNIQSGRIGPGQGAPGLRREADTLWHQLKSATEHVEGHVAALMRRQDGPRAVSLALTQPPCSRRPYGCEYVVRSLLPRGSRLTVYVADRHGTPRYHGTFIGTGEGVDG
jgi:hypothetical protein